MAAAPGARYHQCMGLVGRRRETVELTLRVCAAFGALATGLTLLRLTAGVAVPTPLLGVVAGLAAARGRKFDTGQRLLASALLGTVAAVVLVGELGHAWAGVGLGDALRLLLSPLAAGALVAAFAHAGMRVAQNAAPAPYAAARPAAPRPAASRILHQWPSRTSSPR